MKSPTTKAGCDCSPQDPGSACASTETTPLLGDYLPWLRRSLPSDMGGTADIDEARDRLRREFHDNARMAALPWLRAGSRWFDKGRPGTLPAWWRAALRAHAGKGGSGTTEVETSISDDSAEETAAASSGPVRYAINTLKVYEPSPGDSCRDTRPPPRTSSTCYAPKYGTAEQIMDDVRDLGATVVRHPNVVDFLAGGFDWPDGTIPLYSDGLSDNVRDARVFSWLGYLGEASGGTRLALVFLSAGGGANAVTVDSTWTTGEITRASHLIPSALNWGMAHDTQSVTDGSSTLDFNTSTLTWDRATLDPTNAYKRYYYGLIASAIADKLATMYSASEIGNYIDSVEIGNEVDVCDLVRDDAVSDKYRADYESWAQIVFDVAPRFTAGGLKVKFPAIASSSDGTPTFRQWDAKMAFLTNLARAVYVANGSHVLDSMISGVDLHYYHRYSGDRQRLAFMVADVGEVLYNLVTFGRFFSAGAFEVTMMEIGVGTWCDQETDTWGQPPASDDSLPPSYESGCEKSAASGTRRGSDGVSSYTIDGAMSARWEADGTSASTDREYGDYWGTSNVTPTVLDWAPTRTCSDCETKCVGVNDFQAISVWVRLAAAAAAGASIVGWHTLMAPDADEGFLGTGLRRDYHADTADPSVALQRPSYAAFQLYVSLLGGASSVNLVSPARDGEWDIAHSTLQERISGTASDGKTWALANDVWVIEYVWGTGGSATYAYLLSLDPYGSLATASATLTMESPTSDDYVGGRTIEPWSVTHSRIDGELPGATWQYGASWVESTSEVNVCLERVRYPVLITASARMVLTSVDVSASVCGYDSDAGCT